MAFVISNLQGHFLVLATSFGVVCVTKLPREGLPLVESFCHVGGGNIHYGHPCVVLAPFESELGEPITPQNCCQCGKDWSTDTTGPVARPTEPQR